MFKFWKRFLNTGALRKNAPIVIDDQEKQQKMATMKQRFSDIMKEVYKYNADQQERYIKYKRLKEEAQKQEQSFIRTLNLRKNKLISDGYNLEQLINYGRKLVSLFDFVILKTVLKYQKTLAAKYAQLVYFDDYGEPVFNEWIKVIKEFKDRFIFDKNVFAELTPSFKHLIDKNAEWCDILQNLDDNKNIALINETFPHNLFCMRHYDNKNKSDIVFESSFGAKYQEDISVKKFFAMELENGVSQEEIDAKSMDLFILLSITHWVGVFMDNPNLIADLKKVLDIKDINVFVKTQISSIEYENIIATKLRKLGFNAHTTKASCDQGVDILADKDGVSFAVQCKKYSHYVGNKAVQEITAGREYYNKNYGVVITNAGFTKAARQLANANNIILLNDNQIEKLLEYINK